jgi:tetratricopeptide (TPR) repeat protein
MTACQRAVLVLAGILLLPGVVSARQTASELRARGLELGFNLDYAEAIAAFRESIAADPAGIEGYRLLATVLWSSTLFKQGAITADDVSGESMSPFRARESSAALDSAAADVKRRADALAASQRGKSPPDPEALYQVGAAYRMLGGIAATIEGSRWRSLGAARRAYQEHQRVMASNPSQMDAVLTVGTYRFLVSNLPAIPRLAARVAGFDGDRELGVRLVEQAAAKEGSSQASALFSLIVIYNQLERYDDALRVTGRLQRRFPRNRLLWLEAASTELRAGRAADARLSLERGLQLVAAESRPLAFGELSRWRYYYGVSLARLQDADAATQQFRAALQAPAPEWVHGRAHLELGKLAWRSGDAAQARTALQSASRLCETADDAMCLEEIGTALKPRKF